MQRKRGGNRREPGNPGTRGLRRGMNHVCPERSAAAAPAGTEYSLSGSLEFQFLVPPAMESAHLSSVGF